MLKLLVMKRNNSKLIMLRIANARQEAQQIVEKAVQQAEATTREQLATAREQIEREKNELAKIS